MTKKQRERVVELLRCAADNWIPPKRGFVTTAESLGIKVGSSVFVAARDVVTEVMMRRAHLDEDWAIACYLEAAQLAEEGWTP